MQRIINLLIIFVTVFVFGIAIFSFFVSYTTINSNAENAIVYIDNKEVGKTPLNKRLTIGTKEIKLTKAGYEEKIQKIRIRPFETKVNIDLKSKRQVFIDKLPITTNEWTIHYNHLDDSFTVIINSAPYEVNVEKSKKWLKENSVDPTTDKVFFSGVAGVRPGDRGI